MSEKTDERDGIPEKLVPSDESAALGFSQNPEPRCPCVLLLDTSESMKGAPIEELNKGLRAFKEVLEQDEVARKRVEVAVVTFDSVVKVVREFETAERFEPPILTAQGRTRMGYGIIAALEMIRLRKVQYRANGVFYHRPWVFMITDGEPQGEPRAVVAMAAQRIREEEGKRRVTFFAVGVQRANMERLREIAVRPPLKLIELKFGDMFVWLSSSMQKISQSRADQEVTLPPTTWGK